MNYPRLIEMATLNDLFKEHNVDLDLEEYILNHEIIEDMDLMKELEYFEETKDGQKIYVFRGGDDESNTYFEYIINPNDKEEDGNVTITFLAYSNDKYENATSFYQEIFDKNGIVTESIM